MTDPRRRSKADDHDDEHDRAQRRYTAALIALDAAGEPAPPVTAAGAAASADVARLNQVWGGSRGPAGVLTRIAEELGRLLPWRRRRLHGAMVAAINHNTEATRALIDATQHFHSHVIWYAQTVAALAAAPKRRDLDQQGLEALERALNALTHDWLIHWDSLTAREQRFEGHVAALRRRHDELQQIASLALQGSQSLKRAVKDLAAAAPDRAAGSTAADVAAGTASTDLDAYKYVAFEDRFRGTRDDVRARLEPYLPLFAAGAGVVELGCGRGEFLDLLRQRGIPSRGIDTNDAMVAACRERGLDAAHADALAYLRAQPDASLGGVVAIQVVEHLEPAYLSQVVDAAWHKLAPGAPLVLETINAACWAAFFDSYLRDLTHTRPLHPDTLQYLVQASGFSSVEVRFLSPVADQDRLPEVRAPASESTTIQDLVEALNAHATKLNSQLFSYRDYAIIARR
jgi:SAM-dependent methyltransferase